MALTDFCKKTPLHVLKMDIKKRYEIVITKGFVTDFASVPRPLWWVFPQWEIYGHAALLHDFLYWDHICLKEQADSILLNAT
jgi:Protein of unknown function (DUF1353)